MSCHLVEVDRAGGGTRRQIVGGGGDFERSSHHVNGEATVSDCLVCHDQSDHGSGTIHLKDPDDSDPIEYRGSMDDHALEEFCVNCHDDDGAAGNLTPFSDGVSVPSAPPEWEDSAHSTGEKSCFGDGVTTGCHGNAHGSEREKLLYAAPGETDLSMEGFCYNCHTDGMLVNNAISGSDLADDIEQAFNLGNKHDLDASFTVGGNTYTLQCTSCHNPHVVTGKYWEADEGKSPVTRPDFSDPTGNPRAMGATLWGDESGEKMDDYAGGGTYRTPSGDPFAGSELPDYNTLCEDCHEAMPDPSAQPGAHGQLQFSADPHGRSSANVPDGGDACPQWENCGKGVTWSGDNCTADDGGGSDAECWPVIPRGSGE